MRGLWTCGYNPEANPRGLTIYPYARGFFQSELYKRWVFGRSRLSATSLLEVAELAERYKEKYCKGDYHWCGRYMAFKAEKRESKREKYANPKSLS